MRSYVQRSLVYKHKGNLDQAHRDIVAALALNPSDAEAKALQEQLRSLMAATPTGKSKSATTVATAQPQGTTIAKGAVPCVDKKRSLEELALGQRSNSVAALYRCGT